MEESETILTIDSMKSTITPLPEFLPDPLNPPKRADLLSLKLKLASLLSPEDGSLYWSTLIEFLTGKINREELGLILKLVLGETGEAVQVHNALLLSILYNTTRPYLPPASLSHTGWHKRRRDKDGSKIEDRDPKKRRIKNQVMALGKRERAEIKSLAIVKKDAELASKGTENAGKGLLRASLDSKGGKVGKDGLPLALKDIKTGSTLEQDYARCLQAPLCCESKMLPDIDTLKDRMSLISYDSGLVDGVDSKAAALALLAIDTHLKSMVTSVISLIRSNRANGIRTTSRTQLDLLASTFNPILPTASTSSSSSHPTIIISNGNTTVPLESLQLSPENMSDSAEEFNFDAPLTTGDFSSLFEISPHILAREHLGVIEKLYAIAPPSSDSSSSEYSSDDGDDEEDGGNIRKLSTPSRSNSRSSRSGRSNSNGGREQYLIDPSAIAIPQGHHPDVTHTHPTIGSLSLPSPSSSTSPHLPSINNNNLNGNNPSLRIVSRKTSVNNFSLKNGHSSTSPSSLTGSQPIPISTSTTPSTSTPAVNGTRSLSPTSASLRAQLFPELENSSTSTNINSTNLAKVDSDRIHSRRFSNSLAGRIPGGIPQSPNFTSSDGGSESDDNNITSSNLLPAGVSGVNGKLTGVGKVVDGTITGLGRNPVRGGSLSGQGGINHNSSGGIQNGTNSTGGVVGGRKLWEVVDSHRLMNGLLD